MLISWIKSSWLILGILLAVETASFITYFDPRFAPWFFAVAATGAIIITFKNLEWGLYAVILELIIGSQGYIFSWPVAGLEISFRLLLWLIVLICYLLSLLKTRRLDFAGSSFFKIYLLLAAAIVWGIGWGLVNGNGLNDLFFDVNNYFFFLLIFPFYSVFKDKGLTVLINVIAIGLVWLAAKTLFFFYVFSHNFPLLQDSIYYWTRATLLAEITNVSLSMSRIFMQSQIWIIFGLFAVWSTLLFKFKKSLFALAAILSAVIIISFSRSFWAALLLTMIVSLPLAYLYLVKQKKILVNFTLKVSLSLAIGFGIVATIIFIPIPPGGGNLGMLKERASRFSGDVSLSTRWAILRPLLWEISKHPVLGSGFGSSVTYKTSDPRALVENPDGFYTTTAFEWGYLDMILEFGLLGLGIYLYLIFRIIKLGLNKVSELPDSLNRNLLFGAILGFMAVVLTHGVSPYLNHPLGITIVILMTIVSEKKYDVA